MNMVEKPKSRDAREVVREFYNAVLAAKPAGAQQSLLERCCARRAASDRQSGDKTLHKFFTSVSEAFPDFKINIASLVVNGDRVMVRYNICGVQQGNFMGVAPTHQRMTISGIDIFRLDNGRVIEHWDAAHQINAD